MHAPRQIEPADFDVILVLVPCIHRFISLHIHDHLAEAGSLVAESRLNLG